MSVRTVVIGLACVALLGCPKKENADPKEDASAKAEPDAKADASVTAAAAADASTGPGAKAGASFAGKYTVSAGTMYVPAEKDWASVKFKNDETKLLGEGVMKLAIDPSGRVAGTTEGGPLGEALIDGSSDGQTLSATVRRKDPKDDGLTGTLVAKLAGDKLDGTMNLAEFNAAVVRTATFAATKN